MVPGFLCFLFLLKWAPLHWHLLIHRWLLGPHPGMSMVSMSLGFKNQTRQLWLPSTNIEDRCCWWYNAWSLPWEDCQEARTLRRLDSRGFSTCSACSSGMGLSARSFWLDAGYTATDLWALLRCITHYYFIRLRLFLSSQHQWCFPVVTVSSW